MREWPEFPVGRGAAALLRLYPHQYPWGESCALTVSLLLGFAEAAHDSELRNDISELTVVCGLRNPARARAADAHRSIFTVWTLDHIFL